MSEYLAVIIDATEKEYHGGSFNGPSLRKMLDGLTLEEVTSTATYEGYSVWSIVLHLMYWKYELAAMLSAPGLPDYPYPKDNWGPLPEDPTQVDWEAMLAMMDRIHNAYVAALRTFPAEKLSEKMAFGCTWAETIGWMTTHDTYHIAQIRNMGLKHFDERG